MFSRGRARWILFAAWGSLLPGCKDAGTGPSGAFGNSLCYETSFGNHWEIFTNNLAGTNPQNVSNYADDDEYPEWSPDGRYIVFSRSIPLGGPLIYVYDVWKATLTDLTADGGGADLEPKWTPTGKVCFGYPYAWAKFRGTYIMNPDGSGRKKILDMSARTIYFYHDGYNFLYVVDTKVYKTNLDNTINDLVLDMEPAPDEFINVRGFNPLTGELLVNTNAIAGFSSAIATYSVDAKRLSLVLAADSGYTVYQQVYSADFLTIAVIEHGSNDEYLSVCSSGVKRRLVRIPASQPPVYFSFNQMRFAPDGRHVAYSKQVWNAGQWVSWTEYLYVVDVHTGDVHYIDKGFHPSWNPGR